MMKIPKTPSQLADNSPSEPKTKQTNPLKEDFRKFLYVIWKHLNLPEPTPRQYEMAEYLQHGPKRRMIQAFRGVGKSWVTAAFVLWLLYRNPQLKIMVVSASSERAKNFTKFTLSLINELNFLSHLKPKSNQRQSTVSFDVGPSLSDQAPSVVAKGITGQLTGGRADVIIADDIEVPNNSATQAMREHLSEQVKEFESILKPEPHCQIVYLGTPQSIQSVYINLPSKGFDLRIWPVKYPTKKYLDLYGKHIEPTILKELENDPTLEDTSTEPSRFTDEVLQQKLLMYGRSGFDLQFMLNTHLSDLDKFPLRLSDLVVLGLNTEVGPQKVVWGNAPELVRKDLEAVGLRNDRYYSPQHVGGVDLDWIPYQGSILFIDPSGRGKDETAWVILKQLHSNLFLVDAGAFQGDGYSDSVLGGLVRKAKEHKVNRVIYEANYGDGMFGQLLKPIMNDIYPCTIEEVKNYGKSKENRIIDVLEPVMNQHRLIVSTKVIEWDLHSTVNRASDSSCQYQLFFQMANISRDKGCLTHDDRLDALAGAVAWFIDQMSQDQNTMIDRRKEELMDEALRNFESKVFGRTKKAQTWVQMR